MRNQTAAAGQLGLLLVHLVAATGCGSKPPPSQFPDAERLLQRMHETYACSRGVSGEAKIDYYESGARVRVDALYVAVLPSKVRFDAFSPFGLMLSTMTSDGQTFSLFDLREKVFWRGPASACNLALFAGVNVPPHVLVQLLRGEAPVLVHEPSAATLAWDSGFLGGGEYLVEIASRHDAVESIRAVPPAEDWHLPWEEQRVLVNSVEVVQQGYSLYRASLDEHRPARTAAPATDPDGLGPDVPPSGPTCNAPVPRRLRLEVAEGQKDMVLNNRKVVHNPPLFAGRFSQPVPAGVILREARCSERATAGPR